MGEKEVYLRGLNRFNELEHYDTFKYYEAYYAKLSELQSFLIHSGIDVFLKCGRLLNAFRDKGHMPLFHFQNTSSFGVWEAAPWKRGDNEKCGLLWESIIQFVNTDDLFTWSIWNENPAHLIFSKETATGYFNGLMGFELTINLRKFPAFPDQQLEFTRYCVPKPSELERDSSLHGRLMLGSSDEKKRRFKQSFKLEWMSERSVVYLYNSPFWTINYAGISSYLEQMYGDTWMTPMDTLETDQSHW